MIVGVIGTIEREEKTKKSVIVPVNTKGYEELEIDPANDLTTFSFDKQSRIVGISGNLYKMSLKGYKKLKQYLQKTNQIIMFDKSKRK